jgi:DNA polymerase III subunit gamma/tau
VAKPVEVSAVVTQSIPSSGTILPKPKFKSSKLRSTVELETEVLESNKIQEKEIKAAEQILENKPFDKAGIAEALLACGKKLETQSQKHILKSDFDLEGNQITLRLVNQTLMDLFDELKQEILDSIRKKIQNTDVQLTSILVVAKNEGKPRTEQEKFKAMLEKNPALKTFKDELGLDLIY